ncbi:tetratricopeptide repeat protein [Sphingobium ummariense]|uniref:tetratricopeptide repeat protein n=1 Tax=Sphingobium ummariense TaxID=420994 RepID=UPI000A024E0A|nr:tetratricopeptide repeat protein [Sphingobium ummariense]
MKLVDPDFNVQFDGKKSRLARLVSSPLVRLGTRKARAAARRKDWSRAVLLYQRVLRLAPDRGRLWVQLGHAYGQLGDAEAAHVAYLNATQAQPDLAAGHRHLGYVRRSTSRHEEGMRSLARALFLDPADLDVAELLLAEHGAAGMQASLAKAALAHADETRPTRRPIGLPASWLRSRARKAARRQDWKEAERLYAALTEIRATDPDAFLQLGHALNEQNKQQDAELAYRRAIACDPLYADPWLHLGYVLTAQGQDASAREAFAVVLRLAPDRLAAHPLLSRAERAGPGAAPPVESVPGLVLPPGLGERETAIWLLLAAKVQGRH